MPARQDNSSGRILLPVNLSTFAALKDRVVLAGVENRINLNTGIFCLHQKRNIFDTVHLIPKKNTVIVGAPSIRATRKYLQQVTSFPFIYTKIIFLTIQINLYLCPPHNRECHYR